MEKKTYGIHGSGGKVSTRWDLYEKSSLNSRTVAKFIDLLGEGEIVGIDPERGARDVYLDSTPLQNEDGTYNFSNITFETRNGLPDQPYVEGYPFAENDHNFNNKQIKKSDDPLFTYTTQWDELDAVRITMGVNALYRTKSDKIIATSVRFKVYAKGATDLDYVLVLDEELFGKTTSPYQESYKIPLTGTGPFNIQIERVTDDNTSDKVQNDLYIRTISEIQDVKLTYPNCAYVAMTLDSDQVGSSIPTRTYIVKGTKVLVPTNYNPETRYYDGAWDGSFKLAYTNNPAWCLYDMIINNRYGLGDFVKDYMVDRFSFYQVAKYCDELVPDGFGGYEPRFTLNTRIANREDCFTLLSKMAGVFRGMLFQLNGLATVDQDRPKDVSGIYSPANVIGGEFVYSGTSILTRANVVNCSYIDPDNDWEQSVEQVIDEDNIFKYGWNSVDLDAFGCTSRGQARRLAEWYLYSSTKETESCSFEVGMDSVFVIPGDIIRVIDPSYLGARYGGRIKARTITEFTLDSEVTLQEGHTYNLSYVLPDGNIKTVSILNQPETTDKLLIADTLTTDDLPKVNAMWSLEGSDAEGRLFRVISISETDKHTYAIKAVEHKANKYAYVEQGIKFDDPPTSLLTKGAPISATGLVLSENLYRVNSTLKQKLIASWSASVDTRTTGYDVYYSFEGGQFVKWGTTTSTSIDLEDADIGLYTVRVITNTLVGQSAPLTGNYEVRGKTAPPGNVKNFKAINGVDSAILSWDPVEDIDLVGYEIRKGSWDDNDVVVDVVYGTTVTIPYKTAEKTIYCIKAIDESGNYSDAPAYVEAQAVAPADVIRFTVVPQLDDVRFDWDPVEGIDVQYQIREGDSWETSYELITTKATSATLLLPARPESNGEERVFWIKAVSPVGLWSENPRYTTTILKLFEDRNLIMHYNNATDTYDGVPSPEQPEPYRGTFYNMEIYAETGGSYAIYMEDKASFGEHYFKVDLTEKYRARSWLSAPVIQKPLGVRWVDATFRWESTDAQFQWYPTGDIDGVTFKKYIYREVADLGAYVTKEHIVYSFSLDETLNDLIDSTIHPADADISNIIYTDARMTKGLLQSAVTKCIYRNVPFPLSTTETSTQFPLGVPTFMFGFRIRKDVDFQNTTRLMELWGDNNTKYLFVGTVTKRGKLYAYCRSESGQEIEFDTGLFSTDQDFLYFGILQTSAKRTLYVYATIRNVESYATIDFTPTAQYDTISLTQMAET